MRLKYQFELIKGIRKFFDSQGFDDVLTPPIVENPGMEPHIFPFEVHSISNIKKGYLHTSPEFHMKKLLSLPEEELNKIFTLSYCFRDEPSSITHRHQFLMLEWYRKNERYEKIMDDAQELIKYCSQYLYDKKVKLTFPYKEVSYQRVTVQELIQEKLNFDILNFLETDDLKRKLEKDFKDVPLPSVKLSWDDYYFLLFLNEVEPDLINHPYLLINEFPHHLKSLSTLKEDDSRVCERFEIYLNGIELANCYNELTNAKEQKERFKLQHQEKFNLYNYELPEPKEFYQTLDRGLPPSAGIALGVERLLMGLTGIKNPFF
jgi:lysyl-tRNA synthetase class 2